MKRTLLTVAALTIVMLTVTSGMAQRPVTQPARPTPTPAPTAAPSVNVPPSKIALINTSLFADPQNGIFRYIDAVKGLEPEFRARGEALKQTQTRINTLATEIQTLSKAAVVDQRTIQNKRDEGERLQADLSTQKKRLDEDFGRRYEEVTSPVSAEIGKAIDQFAEQRGITMTLDITKIFPALVQVSRAVDITEAFIADFNRTHPRTGAPR